MDKNTNLKSVEIKTQILPGPDNKLSSEYIWVFSPHII